MFSIRLQPLRARVCSNVGRWLPSGLNLERSALLVSAAAAGWFVSLHRPKNTWCREVGDGLQPRRLPHRVIMVRHGQSEANVNPEIYHLSPDSQIHLTKRGWQQAEAAGVLLRGMDLGEVRVVYSPYVRTCETLKGLCKGYGGSLDKIDGGIEDSRIREWSLGSMPSEQAFKAHAKCAAKDPYFYTWAGGESMAMLELRARDFVRELLFTNMMDTSQADTVVIVSHAGAILSLLKCFIGGSCDEACQSRGPHNTEMVVLERSVAQAGSHMANFKLKMLVDPNVDEQPVTVCYSGDGSPSSQWQTLQTSNRNCVGIPIADLKLAALRLNARRDLTEACL